ncbi:hypothetical protein HTZ77_31015 [Nonomuraea sp. SMC257]|uniref:Uncharacterized protein n=1 Tax=Nonomuraea montanisoli TaxID=2741721 RepID=A0A7Y6ICP6_9ACTN|nr:hypothetical protein [Nonomuraea montanisoli]NUW35818.1 hypothetical protein [Nonomuraea montanisoli]
MNDLVHRALAAEAAGAAAPAERAVRDLLTAGPGALRHVLTVAEERPERHHPLRYEVVRRSTTPEAVPVLPAHTGTGP